MCKAMSTTNRVVCKRFGNGEEEGGFGVDHGYVYRLERAPHLKRLGERPVHRPRFRTGIPGSY